MFVIQPTQGDLFTNRVCAPHGSAIFSRLTRQQDFSYVIRSQGRGSTIYRGAWVGPFSADMRYPKAFLMLLTTNEALASNSAVELMSVSGRVSRLLRNIGQLVLATFCIFLSTTLGEKETVKEIKYWSDPFCRPVFNQFLTRIFFDSVISMKLLPMWFWKVGDGPWLQISKSFRIINSSQKVTPTIAYAPAP